MDYLTKENSTTDARMLMTLTKSKSEIVDFLRKWLLKHIMEYDTKYVPSIKEYLNQ